MIRTLRKAGIAAFVASGIILAAAYPARAQTASADDTARFLAGMPPSSASPLAPLTQDRAWQQHARYFNSAFGNVDKKQFAKIRAWSSAKLTAPSPVLFYMFSGPDFLYANAFFPSCRQWRPRAGPTNFVSRTSECRAMLGGIGPRDGLLSHRGVAGLCFRPSG